MRVKDLMTKNVGSCSSKETLATAAGTMWSGDYGCVPVIDEDRRVLGMVTDRDICMATWMQGKPAHEVPVTVPMSKTVWSCRDTDSLESAEKTMRDHRVRRLPVLDKDDRLVGLLSVNDILREAERAPATKRSLDLSDASVRETLAAVCKPRGR